MIPKEANRSRERLAHVDCHSSIQPFAEVSLNDRSSLLLIVLRDTIDTLLTLTLILPVSILPLPNNIPTLFFQSPIPRPHHPPIPPPPPHPKNFPQSSIFKFHTLNPNRL